MRVLIVEDDRDTAEALALLVRECGQETRVANDALQALRTAAEWQPELVLLDIGLPEMDGYSLAARLREEGLANARIVALSGYRPEDAGQSAASIDAYLLKPVRLQVLLDLLN